MVLEAPQLLLDRGGAHQRASYVSQDTGQRAQLGYSGLQEGIFTLDWQVVPIGSEGGARASGNHHHFDR